MKKCRKAAILLVLLLFFNFIYSDFFLLQVQAETTGTAEDYQEQAEARKSLPIDTNSIEDWPTGPEIGAEAAILMEVETGTILYSKNIHEKLYPASTTKMLTCLLAMENADLDEEVKFSYEAVHSVPSDGSNMGMDAGQYITLEECLYGIMVASANEVANAVAEHISGSLDEFANLMNDRAAELGCTDSHFVNANGLYDDNHYTSAHDLALIGRAFFSNEMLCKIGNTPRYHFMPSVGQPDDFYKNNKHQLINGEMPYDGVLGGKTGYTDEARQTLVTGCEQNGMKLVCVILKEESPDQFTDTVNLFNYGFSNFKKINVADSETSYTISTDRFFETGYDVFGSSKPFLSLDTDSSVILPNQAEFEDTDSTIEYLPQTKDSDIIARIDYNFQGVAIGNSYIHLSSDAKQKFSFNSVINYAEQQENITQDSDQIYLINVKQILITVFAGFSAISFILILHRIVRDFHFTREKKPKKKKWKKGRGYGPYKDIDF